MCSRQYRDKAAPPGGPTERRFSTEKSVRTRQVLVCVSGEHAKARRGWLVAVRPPFPPSLRSDASCKKNAASRQARHLRVFASSRETTWHSRHRTNMYAIPPPQPPERTNVV